MPHPPIFYAVILFLSALLGGGIFLITKKQTGSNLKLLLAYSAAYLLGLTLLHLFPELFSSGIAHPGWYVVAGFILQIILEYFSHGIEHGHAHTHEHHHGKGFLMTVMFSLWIHAFIEGMPFGGVIDPHALAHSHDHAHHLHSHSHTHDHRDSLLIGISLHKITESLVFMALLIGSGLPRQRAYFWMIIFALVAPLGAFVHYFIGESQLADLASLTPKVTGILIGIILHVATTMLFESEEGHQFNRKKFAAILLGIASAALMSAL